MEGMGQFLEAKAAGSVARLLTSKCMGSDCTWVQTIP